MIGSRLNRRGSWARCRCCSSGTQASFRPPCQTLLSPDHKYGVINPGQIEGRSIDIIDIVEKPKLENAPSNIAVCGRYILNSSIFDCLKKVKPDNSGEIQLTDAIKMMLESESVSACIYEGEKFDCGSKKGFVEATIAIALRDSEIRDDIKSFIAKVKS